MVLGGRSEEQPHVTMRSSKSLSSKWTRAAHSHYNYVRPNFLLGDDIQLSFLRRARFYTNFLNKIAHTNSFFCLLEFLRGARIVQGG